MKIGFIGFPKFLKALIYDLKDTPFLLENDIDILFITTRTKKKLSWYFKKISWGKVVYLKDSFLYKKQIAALTEQLFPDNDISFTQYYPNIKEIIFDGLENIKNMEEYDYFIIATFSGKIPEEIINKPKNKILNIHTSFLPELRGGYATYVDAYMNKSYSGVSIHVMNKRWDAGPVIIQKKIPTNGDATNYERIMLTAQHAAELLNQLHKHGFITTPIEQDDSKATYCKKIIKAKREISSILPEESLEGYVRANNSKQLFPFTFCIYRLSVFSILKIAKVLNILPEKYNKANKKIIKYKNSFYIRHSNVTYRIEQYFFRGKLYSFLMN